MANTFTQLYVQMVFAVKHHKKRSFREEYIALLKAFEIEYEEAYLFEWIS